MPCATRHIAVVAVGYDLAPKGKFPLAANQNCYTANYFIILFFSDHDDYCAPV